MRNSSKILVAIAVIAAVAIVASVMKLGKGGGGSPIVQPTNEDRIVQAPQTPEASSTSTIKHIVRTSQLAQPTQNPLIAHATNENPVVPKVAPGQMADWDEKVSDVLGAEGDEKDKAKKLVDLFPHLPPEGQEEVAHHLSNLVADEDYAPLSNFVTNSALPEAVLDVFVEDVFNRPNAIKLPVLLDIAQDPQHPRASEAKDVLELFLEEDFGSDWTKWHAKMEKWLKDNPD
jgi:hypothetical protein